MAQQSQDRTNNYIRDISSYFTIRRRTIGAEPSFVINTIHISLPDELIHHPTIERLTLLTIDMLLIGNDILSYNVEFGPPKRTHILLSNTNMVALGRAAAMKATI